MQRQRNGAVGWMGLVKIFEFVKQTQQSGSLNGNCQKLLSSWLPPGGSCHDEISALRNRYFVVTDETNYEKSSPNL